MIVDSSVWIDLLRRNQTRQRQYLAESLASDGKVGLLPCILQEVLQGSSDARVYAAIEMELSRVPVRLVYDSGSASRAAALLYARCRWSGYTPRSPVDCLIAASCIELDEPLLHNDRDFNQIARIDPRLKFVAA